MYVVYRLQVTLSHAAFPPASTATEIVTWWARKNFLDQGLQGGDGPTSAGDLAHVLYQSRPKSQQVKRFCPTLNASVKWQSPVMVGVTEPRDLWLFALKSNQAGVLPHTPCHSMQAIVLHSSS